MFVNTDYWTTPLFRSV